MQQDPPQPPVSPSFYFLQEKVQFQGTVPFPNQLTQISSIDHSSSAGQIYMTSNLSDSIVAVNKLRNKGSGNKP